MTQSGPCVSAGAALSLASASTLHPARPVSQLPAALLWGLQVAQREHRDQVPSGSQHPHIPASGDRPSQGYSKPGLWDAVWALDWDSEMQDTSAPLTLETNETTHRLCLAG